jgi:2-polyprenyl-6-methoxyphenol hydroxylase-like FAD-dependent oxidoreductase
MSSTGERRALVIGASISGLAAAALLRRAGWSVAVFERSETELKGRGAGIMTHPELAEILEESGADAGDLGVAIDGRVTFDAAGEVIGTWPLRQIVTSWDRLQGLFRRLIPGDAHHLGRSLVGIEQDERGVTARFADGSAAHGDLLVAADGFRSAARAQYAPAVQPLYAGYVIWRGICDEAALPADAHRALAAWLAFFLSPGGEALGYLIPGIEDDLRPGHRRYNWVWYRAAPEAWLNDALTDADGRYYPFSIPPPLVRDDLIAAMREDGERILAPQFRAALRRIVRPFFTPIYDFASQRLVFGRVALIGDAAFLARPHVGMGVTKGAADARALAQALAAEPDISAALRRYEAERRPVGELSVRRGRELGRFLGPGDAGTADVHDHMVLMRETAVTSFLHLSSA